MREVDDWEFTHAEGGKAHASSTHARHTKRSQMDGRMRAHKGELISFCSWWVLDGVFSARRLQKVEEKRKKES